MSTINTEVLVIGESIKNYKELCKRLDVNVCTGNQKKAQEKEFRRYFDWERVGYKYIITQIYPEPLPKDNGLKSKGNNNIYTKSIEVILLDFLSKTPGYTYTMGRKEWWRMLGMVNEKFASIDNEELKSLSNVITNWEISNFYARSYTNLNKILTSALNSLQRQRLIEWEQETIIAMTDQFGETVYHPATDEEKKNIMSMERYVLTEIFDYVSIIQVICRNQQEEFYNKVGKLIQKEYEWSYYFKRIKILYNQKDALKAISSYQKNLEKLTLNNNICKRMNKDADNKYEKAWLKYNEECDRLHELRSQDSKFIKPNPNDISSKVWHPPYTYKEAQYLLTDKMIKLEPSETADVS